MLREVLIAGEASYDAAGQRLAGLKEINFIFGTNGSGKTTVSRVIADPSAYPSCTLSWAGQSLECLVYNSDFVAKNFAAQMPGIFTLGEAEDSTLKAIDAAKAAVTELEGQIQTLLGTLGDDDGTTGKRKEAKDQRAAIEERCWAIKSTHDPHFKEAFTGARNSRSNFCDRVLSEWAGNAAQHLPLDDLKKRALTVFQAGLEKQPLLPVIDGRDLVALEDRPILAKKVVGKEDLDIAALITRLANSDWVRQGRDYLAVEKEQCPFCQQSITGEFRQKLEDYFDETYVADIAAIDAVIEAYALYGKRLIDTIDDILTTPGQYIDAQTLKADRDRLDAMLELNNRLLANKRNEASTPVTLESVETLIAALVTAIEGANAEIATHNAMVDNLATEKATLTAEIWKCLIEESRQVLADYETAKTNLEKAIAGLTGGIEAKRAQLLVKQAELAELEKGITSVQPTVTEINAILASFGFTNFRLATAGEHQHLYEIVRGDGSDATTTLSEGERSFIAFLYFFHLVRGSVTTSGMTNDRVIVFDDPVSSLDSDVLFIVSALIKQLLQEACAGTGYVKQVILLTHNIYFHKEVSFDPNRQTVCRAHETFWIIRKSADQSTITNYDHNPIKTSYELLWAEVRNPQRSKQTIQNTLRRILENYFRILGNMDKDAIIALFDGRDKQICASLFSWVNDGSHSFHDDLYISADDGVVDRYLNVFRRIFENTNHLGHYEMMMGPPQNLDAPESDEAPNRDAA